MTRINSAIPVKCLTDEHLTAEHREIKRLPRLLDDSLTNGKIIVVPSSFRLGTGHVKFFLNKQLFIFNRYKAILEECKKRGINVTDYSDNWYGIEAYCPEAWHDYTPTVEEKKLLVERISSRILASPKSYFHYNKHIITKQYAIELLTREDL